MIAVHTLLFVVLLQAGAAGQPLRSGCSADDRQIASVSPSDQVEVQSALAAGGETCYKINVTRSGDRIAGYALGESLPAIAVFVHSREKASEESAREEARLALEAAARAKKPAKELTKSTDPLVSTQFEDFAGRDAQGKTG